MRSAAFTILVVIMILLFAFTFAVLGKGEYQPSTKGPQGASVAASLA